MKSNLLIAALAAVLASCAYDAPDTTPKPPKPTPDSTAFYNCDTIAPYAISAYCAGECDINRLNNASERGVWNVEYAAQVVYYKQGKPLCQPYWREVSRETYLKAKRHFANGWFSCRYSM